MVGSVIPFVTKLPAPSVQPASAEYTDEFKSLSPINFSRMPAPPHSSPGDSSTLSSSEVLRPPDREFKSVSKLRSANYKTLTVEVFHSSNIFKDAISF